MRRYRALLAPLLALPLFYPAYAKRSRERMPGPARVRALTFDQGPATTVINEFAVASPDGKYVVTQHSTDPRRTRRPDGSEVLDFKESSNWDIFRRAASDGSGARQLTSLPASEDQPTWSPDGRTLVYRMLNGPSFDLFLMDADGAHKRPLLIDPDHDEKTPAFSRDGRRVVFFSDRDGVKWNLYTIDVQTRAVTRLTHDPVEDKHPQFLPDGRVVFHSSRGARIVTLEGGETFHLMNLWVLDPSTGALRQITKSEQDRDNRHAWVSPDGRLIAYHSNVIEPDPAHPGVHRKAHRELCITDVDGLRHVNLTQGDPRNFKHPSWSADGTRLFFVYKESGHAWNAGSMDVSSAVARLRR